MNKDEFSHQTSGPWWKAGVQVLSEVSTWIVVPIVCALVFGKMLDAHYGTKPKIFLVFAALGFLVTCYGIYKIMKDYMKKLQETDSSSHKDEDIKSEEKK